MTPKEYKQMMDYLTRKGIKKPFTPASAIQRPKKVLEIEAFKDFNERNPVNKADGGRIGFKKGKKATVLTTQMITDIAEKNPDFTAKDILNKLQKSKTKNYVTATGTPISRSSINATLSKVFDLQAAEKAKVPEGYISPQEFFNTPGMPISKHNYMTVKNRNPSLLTDTIGKNAIFVKRGVAGEGAFYYKKPTKEDIKLYQRIASRKGQLAKNTVNLMLEFDKKFSKSYAKGELPLLKELKELFPGITPGRAGNVTARLSQWYNGTDFLNPELKSIKRNKSLAKNIQKASSNKRFGSFYADQAYQVALDTIDEKIGRQTGSFKAFKDNIKTALKEAGLPIYSKDSPYGFNLNEIAGVTGASRTKTAEFSDFVDIAEGNFNQKKLARFQKDFAKVREQLDKLDLPNNPKNNIKAQSLINDFKETIAYYEKATGSELPKLGLGTADKYYPKEQLADIAKERFVGETGKKKNRRIPGTDLLSSSKNAGYTVIVPKNYRTVGQIMETGERGILKKNVQNTLEGMKKFFNEYDEKKMLQKLKDSSPETLKKMMRVIPKVVSIEDDFLNAYGFPLTAGLDSSIGVQPVEREENFILRNPGTTAAAGTTAGTIASVGSKFTKKDPLKGFRRGAKTILKRVPQAAFLTPTGVAATTLGFGGLDLTTPAGRLSLGAELAAAPELVKASIGATRGMKNRALQKGIQRVLNFGPLGLSKRFSVPLALKLARVAQPLGLASLGLEGAYQAGKFTKKRIGELRAMSPEQRQELRRKGDEFAFNEFAAAGGGIAKEAGDPSGAMLESMNPDSQGLPSLLKRDRKG